MATSVLTQISSARETLVGDAEPLPQGLDGVAVAGLLQGAVVKGHDPRAILRKAAIDPSVYGDARAAIDGRALSRLGRHTAIDLDDVHSGFMRHSYRPALEAERIRSLVQCATLGELVRVSCRFSEAISADIRLDLIETHEVHGPSLSNIFEYQTADGVDRDLMIWESFVWNYHFFSWCIGRPLSLRGISVRGARPVQANGFDRFSLFRCPVEYMAPVDAMNFDKNDLMAPLVHHSHAEYAGYFAGEIDLFAPGGDEKSWHQRTEYVLAELAREGLWSVPIELIATKLKTRPRRLRRELAREGVSFQEIRTRFRGELASAYLLATDLPVTTISWEVGFSAPDSFTRSFVGWAGMTPSDYRARHKADKARVAAATTLLAGLRTP